MTTKAERDGILEHLQRYRQTLEQLAERGMTPTIEGWKNCVLDPFQSLIADIENYESMIDASVEHDRLKAAVAEAQRDEAAGGATL